MKKIVLAGFLSVFLLTACKKDERTAEKSLEQQKLEFQARQLEIEKQKLAIEKEKLVYEAQKKADSIAEDKKSKAAAASNSKPQIIRETKPYTETEAPTLIQEAEVMLTTVPVLHKELPNRKKG